MLEPEAPTTGLGKCHRSLKNSKNMEIPPEGMCVTHCSCQGNCRKISTDKPTYPRSSPSMDDKPITPGNSDCSTPFKQLPHCSGAKLFVGDKQPPAHANHHAPCENSLLQIPKSGIALSPPRKGNSILLPFASHPVATRREEPTLLEEFFHPESRRQPIPFIEQLSGLVLCHL